MRSLSEVTGGSANVEIGKFGNLEIRGTPEIESSIHPNFNPGAFPSLEGCPKGGVGDR